MNTVIVDDGAIRTENTILLRNFNTRGRNIIIVVRVYKRTGGAAQDEIRSIRI